MTLLSIYLLVNLHPFQSVDGIMLNQGKEIHPIP